MTAALLPNEAELYLAPGGPFYRRARTPRIASADRRGASAVWRISRLLLITWVPMCLFAILQGCALTPTPRGSFLRDFATYARFFVGLPILVVADGVIGSRLTRAGQQLVRDGFVGPDDYPAFEQAIARLARRRESLLAGLVLVGMAVFGPWRFTLESVSGVGTNGWRTILLPEGHVLGYSLAALWNNVVALPIALFLMYRWLWRIVIWTLFLLDVARLDLKLVATHSDRAGGLGFLARAHVTFGTLAFAVSCVLSAEACFRIVYEGARLSTFQVPLLVMVAVTELLVLGPLLVFCPIMARTRWAALRSYGSLVVRYNRGFEEKWVEGAAPHDEPLLGTSDIQSLADLGNSFRFVSDMRPVPFGRVEVVELALLAALPGLPLLLLVVPMRDIVNVLTKIAL